MSDTPENRGRACLSVLADARCPKNALPAQGPEPAEPIDAQVFSPAYRTVGFG